MPLHSDEISLQLSPGGWLPSTDHHTFHLSCSRAFPQPHPSGMLLQLPPRPLQALTGSGCRRALPQFSPASSDGHFMSTCSRLQEFKEKDTREGTGGIGAGRASGQRVMTVKCVCVGGDSTGKHTDTHKLAHSGEQARLEGGRRPKGCLPKGWPTETWKGQLKAVPHRRSEHKPWGLSASPDSMSPGLLWSLCQESRHNG